MSNVTPAVLRTELAKFTPKADFDRFTRQAASTYARKTEVAQLQPKGDYATKNDLSNYASKNDLANYASKNDLANYPSITDIKAANFATRGDLANYVSNKDLSETLSSELFGYQKKGNYLTEDDLQTYASKDDLNNYQPKGSYLLRSEFPQDFNPNLYQPKGDYASKSDLNNYQPKGEYQPKGDYALMSQIPDVSSFQVKGDYASKSDLAIYQPKGEYALRSQIPDLSNYALRSQIPDTGSLQPKGDYALKSEIQNFQPKGEYALRSQIPDLSTYALRSQIPDTGSFQPRGNYALKSDLPDVNRFQPKGDYQPTGDYMLKSEMNFDFDKFSGGGDGVFSSGWESVQPDNPKWDFKIRGEGEGRKGLAYTNAWGDQTTDASVDILVPNGMKTGYLFHLAWDNCRFFDIFGVTASNKAVFIRRVTAYQNLQNLNQDELHSGVKIVTVPRVDRFTRIRIQGRKGRVHYMGMGWSKSVLAADNDTGVVRAETIQGPFSTPMVVNSDHVPGEWTGLNIRNRSGAWTHFDWLTNGWNYIRGNTRMDGQVDVGGALNVEGCLKIGEHQLCSDGPSLVIQRPGQPKKIILWTGGDHSSMMTQRNNNTDNWFGY